MKLGFSGDSVKEQSLFKDFLMITGRTGIKRRRVFLGNLEVLRRLNRQYDTAYEGKEKHFTF